MTSQPNTPRKVTGVRRIRVSAPPDQTPEQEAALVAAVAAAYEETHGHRDVDIDVDHPDEVDFRAVADRMFR
jgi:hypothetical protein